MFLLMIPEMQSASLALGQQLVIVNAGTARDIELAFASVVQQIELAALVVQAEPYLSVVNGTSWWRWPPAMRFQRCSLTARYAGGWWG